MLAARMHRTGGPDVLVVEEVPVPEPGPGHVRIRVESAAVNFADVVRRRGGTYPFPTPLPFVPGSEVAGVVESVGDGVDPALVGTDVLAMVGHGDGGYAELAVTAAQQVVPRPAGLSADEAAGICVAGTTASLLLGEVGRLQPGETVLVPAAAGGVGGLTVQLARHLGAGLVVGVVGSRDKVGTARDHGAHEVLLADDPDLVDRVRDLTGGRGVDLALDMAGGASPGRALGVLAPFGRLVVFGAASGEPVQLTGEQVSRWLLDPALDQSVTAFNLGAWFGARPQVAGAALGRVLGLVAAGALRVPVGHVLPLSQVAQAHALLESRRTTGKVVLRPGS
jgi:NADPH2:quinone reductase